MRLRQTQARRRLALRQLRRSAMANILKRRYARFRCRASLRIQNSTLAEFLPAAMTGPPKTAYIVIKRGDTLWALRPTLRPVDQEEMQVFLFWPPGRGSQAKYSSCSLADLEFRAMKIYVCNSIRPLKRGCIKRSAQHSSAVRSAKRLT